MSDRDPNKKEIAQTVPLEPQGAEVPPHVAMPEFIFDKRNNEVTLVGPNDERFTFRTTVIEEEDEEEDDAGYEPLTAEEFEKALSAVDALGLAWTADRTPRVKPKTSGSEDALLSEEFESLQRQYPHLPFEVFLATSHFLTGSKTFGHIAGGEENLKKKANIAGRIIVDREYRTEFFFRSSIKVPYLRDIDWEVVSKLYERGVTGSPDITYALLALALQNPFSSGTEGKPPVRHITVAVDERLVSNLLDVLTEVKTKLVNARRQTDISSEQLELEEQDDNKRP